MKTSRYVRSSGNIAGETRHQNRFESHPPHHSLRVQKPSDLRKRGLRGCVACSEGCAVVQRTPFRTGPGWTLAWL